MLQDIDTEQAERRNLTAPDLNTVEADRIRKAHDAMDCAIANDSHKALEEAQIRVAGFPKTRPTELIPGT